MIHSHKTVSLRDLQRNLKASLPKDNEQVLVTNNGSIDYVISPVNNLQINALGVQSFQASNSVSPDLSQFTASEINKLKHNHGKK